MRRYVPVIILLLAVLSAACAAGQVPDLGTSIPVGVSGSTIGTSVAGSTSSTGVPLVVPEQLADYELRPLTIQDGDTVYVLTVAVADTANKRSTGLMGIADLEDLDGMLFAWDADTAGSFWMKDTLIPLDIAFFAADRSWVDDFSMQPCLESQCESYLAGGSYRYAIEVPEGAFDGLTSAARLVLDG